MSGSRIYRAEDFTQHLEKLILDKILFKKILLVEKKIDYLADGPFVLRSDENGNISWVKYELPERLQF